MVYIRFVAILNLSNRQPPPPAVRPSLRQSVASRHTFDPTLISGTVLSLPNFATNTPWMANCLLKLVYANVMVTYLPFKKSYSVDLSAY